MGKLQHKLPAFEMLRPLEDESLPVLLPSFYPCVSKSSGNAKLVQFSFPKEYQKISREDLITCKYNMSFFFLCLLLRMENLHKVSHQIIPRNPKTAIEKLEEFGDCAKSFGSVPRTQALRLGGLRWPLAPAYPAASQLFLVATVG